LQLVLTPRPGAGETLEQLREPNSNYRWLLHRIKDESKNAILFQVMQDASSVYLEARRIAEEIGVPTMQETLGTLEIGFTVPGFEVQSFAAAPALQ
jgi:hypothetical protein